MATLVQNAHQMIQFVGTFCGEVTYPSVLRSLSSPTPCPHYRQDPPHPLLLMWMLTEDYLVLHYWLSFGNIFSKKNGAMWLTWMQIWPFNLIGSKLSSTLIVLVVVVAMEQILSDFKRKQPGKVLPSSVFLCKQNPYLYYISVRRSFAIFLLNTTKWLFGLLENNHHHTGKKDRICWAGNLFLGSYRWIPTWHLL